jgi:hypothetical protein
MTLKSFNPNQNCINKTVLMKTISAEKWLSFILFLGGITMALAIIPALMPFEWMRSANKMIGLGEFPQTPINEYLARSLSILYAVTGGFSMILATNIKRYQPIILYFSWIHIVIGILLTGIDYQAGMPLWWTLLEGPSVFFLGIFLLYLLNRIPAIQDPQDSPA